MIMHGPLRRAGLACVERSRPSCLLAKHYIRRTRRLAPVTASQTGPSYRQSPSGKSRRKRNYRASLDIGNLQFPKPPDWLGMLRDRAGAWVEMGRTSIDGPPHKGKIMAA